MRTVSSSTPNQSCDAVLGHPQARHCVPKLGDKPSHDLKTNYAFNLCHLVCQQQDVARVMEHTTEANCTLCDVYRDLGILEALVTCDQRTDMFCNLRVLNR